MISFTFKAKFYSILLFLIFLKFCKANPNPTIEPEIPIKYCSSKIKAIPLIIVSIPNPISLLAYK